MNLKTYPSCENCAFAVDKGTSKGSLIYRGKLCTADSPDTTRMCRKKDEWKLEHEKLYVCVLRKDLENSSFQPRCEVYADEAILDCDCCMKNRAVWEEYYKKLREFFEWLQSDSRKFEAFNDDMKRIVKMDFVVKEEEYEEKKKGLVLNK